MKNKSDKNKSDFLKVVYFDENSALEYVDMQHEGRYLFNEENLEEYKNSRSSENAAKLGLNGKLMNVLSVVGLNAGASTESKFDISKSNNKLINSTISSTILTDFLKEVNKDDEPRDIIEITDESFKLPNNSFAYLKAVAPVLKMFSKDFIRQFDDLKDIDVLAIENVLDLTKGYFEFLSLKEGKEIILRLNTSSLKNNYKLGDLLHMKLTFYAVKVGKLDKENIKIENYIGNLDNSDASSTEKEPNLVEEYKKGIENAQGTMPKGTTPETQTNLLDLYDVILAGVKND